MSAPGGGSPYPIGQLVTDGRLLQNRRAEIGLALNAIAPAEGGDSRHAVVLGEQRSGRSSVLVEVGRQAAEERNRLVVWVRGAEHLSHGRKVLFRSILTAVVERLAAVEEVAADSWYQAWRDRVYLRDRSPSTTRDQLSSALLLAADPDGELDTVIFERDLSTLLTLAGGAEFDGVVLCLDDASVLTEDVALVEELLSSLDAVGGYSLLLAGVPATAQHFVQAASPCLARFVPVWLMPFRGPHQIFTSLSAPLSDAAHGWVDAEDAAFLRDVLRLTGGNPYEVMLVGHHLWQTCQSGEQERYRLTPRVLDRVIPSLSLLAEGGDALLDGANAIDRLEEDQVRHAVELVSLSRLSIRQIAIARILKIDSRDSDRVDRAILTADVAEEELRVLAELDGLQEAGVVQLHADRDRFSVVGGRPASVLLKYKARARIGAAASGQPFELSFLGAVGRALARDAALSTLQSLTGSDSLGFSAILSRDGAGRLSPRPAIRKLATAGGISRLVEAEVDLVPWGANEFGRIGDLLTHDDLAVALVYTAVTHGRDQLEYTELWEVPADLSQEHIATAWSSVTEEWEPVAAAAEIGWGGSEFAVLYGDQARQALIVLQRYAATSAVHSLFDRWYKGREQNDLRRAQQIADEAVATMRATGLSEWELGGELSGMLSRVGFLKSLDDDLLGEAREALEEALQTGLADTWVTKWNLANVMARQGNAEEASLLFQEMVEATEQWSGYAFVLAYVPGRPGFESLVKITDAGIAPLTDLQIAAVSASTGLIDPVRIGAAIAACIESGDMGAARAAEWITAWLESDRSEGE